MSMSKYIRAIPDVNKREKAIQTIKNLEQLGLEIPGKLYDIRDNNIDLEHKEYRTDYEDIIEIDVKRIPEEVEKIQFVISY